MTIRSDFLERTAPIPAEQQNKFDLTRTNQLLAALLGEVRKDVPKIACFVTPISGVPSSISGVLGCSASTPANIRFLNEGNPVKSFYTIVVNSALDGCFVSINEPVQNVAASGSLGRGIRLPTTGNPASILVLPGLEIESLSIVLVGNAPAVDITPINAVDPTYGCISVYGWTLPEYSNITE